jgi:pyruvate dehydrogenase E2 component (dihydrolipoamide acetyltransferase)
MATAIAMPKLSATMEEATVVAWHKAAGERVSRGEIILEIETDKSTLTIEAPVAGFLGIPKVHVGQAASVGTQLVLILEEGEREPVDKIVAGTLGDAIDESPAMHAPSDDDKGNIPKQEKADRSTAGFSHSGPGKRVFASPLAKRIARERGLDLQHMQGSGPQGRIRAADLSAISVDRATKARRHIASEVAASRRNIPAFTLTRWIDMEAVLADIAKFKGQRTATDYFVFALARAVTEVPQFRCVWNANSMATEDLGTTNIGIVVDTDRGVVIPTLSDVGALELDEITAHRSGAVAAAREGKLAQTNLARASISLSSLIRDDADEFEAIISPDQTAILAIGRLMERVVSRDGGVAIRRGCIAKLSADHRHIDGRVGARFIGVVARVVEEREEQ